VKPFIANDIDVILGVRGLVVTFTVLRFCGIQDTRALQFLTGFCFRCALIVETQRHIVMT